MVPIKKRIVDIYNYNHNSVFMQHNKRYIDDKNNYNNYLHYMYLGKYMRNGK